MTSAPDHSIDHCTHHSKHCTGCTCRNCKIRTIQFQEQTQQISTHSSQKIDQKIFQFSNCTLQSASKHKQYQHVISKMLRSKMKEHTCKDPIVFSLHNGGSICRSALKHMHGILWSSGKFHCSKNKNIRQNEKHCNRCLFQFFQVLPLFCFFISKTMYHY